ncbi:MAG: hypothetical protein CBC35_02255 [Planctomycetes bacterium TMED75]|nr:hypothetical protein [Planctomycetaceae bacterium]OUU95988.1 MAG: hypothetical protein CBC35_02255 [Planctomycetes bacterium TMED75]
MPGKPETFGAIFDMDGTLLDSYHAHQRSWQQAMTELDIEYTSDDFRRHFGQRNEEIIRDIFQTLGRAEPNDTLIDSIADRKEALFRSVVVNDYSEMPGTTTLIKSLRAGGWKLAVGSSAPRENVELALDLLHLNDLIDETVCGCDVEQGKPAPDVFLKAAESLGLETESCIVIEDAPAGIEAAHRAGMPAVAIECPHHKADLSAAELQVTQFGECPESKLRTLIKEHDS